LPLKLVAKLVAKMSSPKKTKTSFDQGHKKVGGRKKGTPNKTPSEIKTKAQSYGPEMLEIWVTIARDKMQPGATRVSAAEKVVEYGYGKVTQAFSFGGGEGATLQVEHHGLDELVAALKQIGRGSDSPEPAQPNT